MILLDELKVEMEGYLPQIKELYEVLNIKLTINEIEELETKASDPSFWDDIENSQKVLQRTKSLKDKVENYNKLSEKLEDIITLIELCIEENDDSSARN